MQNYTIEHRAPKKGETYIFDEAGRAQTTVAGEDHRIPQDVLVPVAPAWPDKPVIVIDEGEWHGPNTGAIVFKEGIVAIRDDDCGSYTDAEGSLWWEGDGSTITAWHEHVPDGYGPIMERREYTADDLDRLPEGTCVWDEDGDVWQRRKSGVWGNSYTGIYMNPLRDLAITHAYSAPEPGEQA